MAIVSINYDCGCGFHGKTVEEAAAHVDGSGHIMNVAGIIKPSERRVPKIPASLRTLTPSRPRASKPAPVAGPAEVQEEANSAFSDLRAKLQFDKG